MRLSFLLTIQPEDLTTMLTLLAGTVIAATCWFRDLNPAVQVQALER